MKKSSIKTTIENGQTVAISWHLGYYHEGGVQLQLLDSNQELVLYLTNDGEDTFTLGATPAEQQQQSIDVDLPGDLECADCTIRLLRKAKEWGEAYQFQSCADVDIVNRDLTDDELCLGNGTPKSGSSSACDCDALYHGDRCQFKDDCYVDSDCNDNGKCLTVSETTMPFKQCFCQVGFFGSTCEKVSAIKEKSYNKEDFQTVEADQAIDKFQFYWRKLDLEKEELEVVIEVESTSYVAVGWKPHDLSQSCQEFPGDVESSPSDKYKIHPMDCSDIVVAKVKDGLSHVGDYYTRDRSTPRLDSFYGGEDDLTGAVAWEENGKTTVIFRKKKVSDHKTDHDLKGHLRVIWAHGQSGDGFYAEDELKYHGSNRGEFDVRK